QPGRHILVIRVLGVELLKLGSSPPRLTEVLVDQGPFVPERPEQFLGAGFPPAQGARQGLRAAIRSPSPRRALALYKSSAVWTGVSFSMPSVNRTTFRQALTLAIPGSRPTGAPLVRPNRQSCRFVLSTGRACNSSSARDSFTATSSGSSRCSRSR